MELKRAIFFGLLLTSTAPFAIAQTHAGKLDTDGILSPGEIPNRNIDYDRAQREYLRNGDERVLNPDNDELAAEDRENRGQLRYDREREEELLRLERERRRGNRSWWNW